MRTRHAHRGIRTFAVLAAVTVAATACSSDGGSPPTSGGQAFQGLRGAAPVALQSDRSCGDVLDDFQSFAPAVLSDQMFGFVEGGAATTSAAFEDGGDDMSVDADAGGARAAAPDEASAQLEAADGSSSDTNTQEAGIDEPDVVENDGEFVYVVDHGPDQAHLVILDGATAEVLSRTPLASYGAQLLLQGDRMLVVTSGGYGYPMPMPMPIEDGAAVSGPAPDEGVDAAEPVEPGQTEPGDPGTPDTTVPPDQVDPPEPTDPVEPTEPSEPTEPAEPTETTLAPEPVEPTEPRPEPEPEPIPVDPFPMPTEPPTFAAGTVLQLLDVSDRRAPQVVQTTEIEGHHVSTRVVGGVARVVVSSYPDAQPLFEDASMRLGDAGDQDSARAAMEAGIADTTIDDWLPAFRTTVADAGEVASRTSTEGSLVACEDVFVPEVNAGIAQTSVLRVDFTDGFDPADTTTVVAEAGTVYASTSTLYVSANTYVPLQEQGRIVGEDFSTALHAFDLRGDGPAAHLGAGEIPGHLLNQYSLSEHDGYLRAATTEGAPWGGGEDSQSGVRVLQLEGGALVEVGAVTGLGVTETIQSVRFMGPVGYVVTFRQTDPLYVIDLSDPRAPRAVGELKIPGFSSYLHPVGEGRLVGIGRDADLEGRDQGLLVSLFDVADPTAPTQLQTWTERDAWSIAGDDPKAFLHWAPESAVIVPLERFGSGNIETGIVVLDVADSGITERALVTAEGRYPSRALVVQGRLWSLFDGGVVVSDFANPAQGAFTGFR